MLKSYLIVADQVRALLLRFPDIVDSLQRRDFGFLKSLEVWLKETEETLKQHGVAEAARVAGFRSKLFAPPSDGEGRTAARKKQNQIAAEMLFDVQETLLEVYRPIETRLNNCRDIIDQLLGAIIQTGAVKYNSGEGFEMFANRIWTLLTTHEQLRPGMLKVLAMVPAIDARRLVVEEIDLENWPAEIR